MRLPCPQAPGSESPCRPCTVRWPVRRPGAGRGRPPDCRGRNAPARRTCGRTPPRRRPWPPPAAAGRRAVPRRRASRGSAPCRARPTAPTRHAVRRSRTRIRVRDRRTAERPPLHAVHRGCPRRPRDHRRRRLPRLRSAPGGCTAGARSRPGRPSRARCPRPPVRRPATDEIRPRIDGGAGASRAGSTRSGSATKWRRRSATSPASYPTHAANGRR